MSVPETAVMRILGMKNSGNWVEDIIVPDAVWPVMGTGQECGGTVASREASISDG